MVSPATAFALCLAVGVEALVGMGDPSDAIPPAAWAGDNAIALEHRLPSVDRQPADIMATHRVERKAESLDHQTLSTKANDTSVVLVANGRRLELSYVDIVKTGFASDAMWASCWGFNAAVNVANASTATLDKVNITIHNGAASVFAYGNDSSVEISNSCFYSSGPNSRALYALGNATIMARKVSVYSGGRASSAFAGGRPGGYIYLSDSSAHTAGIGSATYHTQGKIEARNVVSTAEQGPVVFSDGAQITVLTDCDGTASLLGAVVMHSSRQRQSSASLEMTNSRLTATGTAMPALWFGNVVAEVLIRNSQLNTKSGILVTATKMRLHDDLDHFFGPGDGDGDGDGDVDDDDDAAAALVLQPAEARIDVRESDLHGDLVADAGSVISWSLASHATWTGAAYPGGAGPAVFNIALDRSSNWTLTRTTTVQHFADEDTSLSNIRSVGYDLLYNSSAPACAWLEGRTVELLGGGLAMPIGSVRMTGPA